MENAHAIAMALNGKKQGDGFIACCPAHDDTNPSLSIVERSGKLLVKCYAGCDQIAVVEALRARQLWPSRKPLKVAPKPVATYSYTDECGVVIYQIIRFEPKTFRARQRDENGRWVANLKDVKPLPFKLKAVKEAIRKQETIYLVEGEKDVLTLEALGLAATCNHGGAGKWKSDHSRHLEGARVVILPDNDSSGREHAWQVCKSLISVAKEVWILELTDLPHKGDVSDWVARGYGATDLLAMVEASAVPAERYLAESGVKIGCVDAGEKPSITCAGGELPRVVREIEDAIIASRSEIFERGNLLVRPVRTQSRDRASSGEECNELYLIEVDEHWLAHEFASVATFQKFNITWQEPRSVDVPSSYVKTYMSLFGRRRIRKLLGIVKSPILKPDDDVILQAGYDDSTHLIAEFSPEWPNLNRSPSRDHARRAIVELAELVRDFPFVTEADRAVFFSAVISAIQRPLLGATPLHAFTAPVAGTGKSKLCDIISIIATGSQAATINWGQNQEESEKRFHALALMAAPVVLIDNIERPFESEALCSYLTQQELDIRILGKSKIARVPTTSLILATGNNLLVSGDLTRRTLACVLDPKIENPEDRVFDNDPVGIARRNRPRLVNAALTILLAYRKSGRPSICAPLGSFEAWSTEVRSALIWAGAADPCDVMQRTRKVDPVREIISTLLKTWYAQYESNRVTVGDALRLASENRDREFSDAIEWICGSGDKAKTLGKFLSRHVERKIDGLQFRRVGERKGATLWMVEKAEG